MNKFFDKIFVISLQDQTKRWDKINKKFKSKNINVERFIALDGRCSGSKQTCLEKLKSFEIISGVEIKVSKKDDDILELLSPIVSLNVGILKILQHMVKKKYEHILILEDDIEFGKNFEARFNEGIKDIKKLKWDLLYLGCGNMCGNKGISLEETIENKIFSELAKIEGTKFYISDANDTRKPCDCKCIEISKNITKPCEPHGGFAIAYSLAGAKKVIKLFENDISWHHDIAKGDNIKNGKLKAYSFDPPIIYHAGGVDRKDSTIPWDWG